MVKTKTAPIENKSSIRGRVARRIKGFQGMVTDLGNQLSAVRDRLAMVETGETEAYLAPLSKRQKALEAGQEELQANFAELNTALMAKIETQNGTIGKLLDTVAKLEKAAKND